MVYLLSQWSIEKIEHPLMSLAVALVSLFPLGREEQLVNAG
jgi:hypothetical protein